MWDGPRLGPDWIHFRFDLWLLLICEPIQNQIRPLIAFNSLEEAMISAVSSWFFGAAMTMVMSWMSAHYADHSRFID